jgi:proteasome accessory factor B
MDRLERLVNLVAALLDAERPLNREELRDRVGGYSDDTDAFRRNFERDKDVLRQMGMPLVTEPLEGDAPEAPSGYRMPRDRYELPDPGLDTDELAALRLAASAVQIGDQDASNSALRKLAAGVAPVGPAMAEVPGGDGVTVAFGAVAERRRVEFSYRGRSRLLDPWRLAYRSGHWYLTGLDHGRDEERQFRLDRVEGPLRAVGEPAAFARPSGAAAEPLPSWRIGDGPEVEVVLLVDELVAPEAVAAAGEPAVREGRDDGSVVLCLAVTSIPALHSFVLGFLDHAEILGPPEVRAGFVAALDALAAPV